MRQLPQVESSSPTGSAGGRRARSEISSSSASRIMFAITELPPKETKGRVTPVSGITFVDPADDHERLQREHRRQPVASSFENPSGAIIAVLNPRAAISA